MSQVSRPAITAGSSIDSHSIPTHPPTSPHVGGRHFQPGVVLCPTRGITFLLGYLDPHRWERCLLVPLHRRLVHPLDALF